MSTAYTHFNSAKINLDDVYRSDDASPYYAEMSRLDYQIPQNSLPWFLRIIDEIRAIRGGDRVKILDVGCSYGVNAALLKYDIPLEAVYHHYATRPQGQVRAARIGYDQAFFSRFAPRTGLSIHGIDISPSAVSYATATRLLDSGHVVDLEHGDAPDELRRTLDGVDLIVSTGCVGYVTEKTFARLLGHLPPDRLPWIAVTVLRTLDFTDFLHRFEQYGLRTERIAGPMKQRTIADDQERVSAISAARALGKPTSTLEELGSLYADLYLSIPGIEAAESNLTPAVRTDEEILDDRESPVVHQ
ncbi:class I SAM-dependent methyltransferase [Amycolatopsis umgeniensis]|uniref:SAM-dependent methyltransferase n=1 Tax=Amycolatopsis umgeniensis TaxID=336628 RepID=A0A841B9W4_9PSEU|nr:class I SAM-dependent methyltransferase [Amycolatopsis umgeniensis]MBB5855673.1 SAM-dependent methyltransferase [Amycolatopsis umgeniensis]